MSKIDLDELESSLALYSDCLSKCCDIGELRQAIQELRLLREVVEAAKALDSAIGPHTEDCLHEYEQALKAYNQHTEGKDTSGGLGE